MLFRLTIGMVFAPELTFQIIRAGIESIDKGQMEAARSRHDLFADHAHAFCPRLTGSRYHLWEMKSSLL